MHARDIPYVLNESPLLQNYAVGSPVNERAVLYMHSRIASHAECVPSFLHMLNVTTMNSEHMSCYISHCPPWTCVIMAHVCFRSTVSEFSVTKTVSCAGLSQLHWFALEH